MNVWKNFVMCFSNSYHRFFQHSINFQNAGSQRLNSLRISIFCFLLTAIVSSLSTFAQLKVPSSSGLNAFEKKIRLGTPSSTPHRFSTQDDSNLVVGLSEKIESEVLKTYSQSSEKFLTYKNFVNEYNLNPIEIEKNREEYFKFYIPLISENVSGPTSIDLLVAGSLGMIIFQKDEIISQNISQYNESKAVSTAAKVGDLYAVLGIPSIGLGSYLIGLIKDKNEIKEIGIISIGSILSSAIVFSAVKRIAARSRPYNNLGPNSFGNDGSQYDFQSFYSGHASTAFAFASSIHEYYKLNHKDPFVPYVLYGLASLTAWSRVNDRQHYLSDVLVGSAMGYYIGRHFTQNFLNPDRSRGLEIFPHYNSKTKELKIAVIVKDFSLDGIPTHSNEKCIGSVEVCFARALNK